MRIIAIGIGGAGCRIVDSLYATDRRSSKVACVQGLAVDVDEKSMEQLEWLPENAKMCFSALDPGSMDPSGGSSPTATIDIGEIISRIQNFESGENDAIVFCCGLGGSLVDVAPHIIAGLRSSIVEPIFGLVTLPCLAEGERISAKAADDIEMLSTLLDGIIVFDNETWYKKIKAEKAHLRTKEKGFAEKMGFKKSEKVLSPAQATYNLLNQAIVRRISLILRAGEFKADGGIDLAEVVLDSGEVLNTMKGMGFITIGYAVEQLPHDPLSFLSRWKPAGLFDEEQKKKASRIVELAKQAIYHEISTPCDLTSAHKALILVAGPSHELSMKGFMTVRKWIDRSIAGLETRSGDYPVMNTKNVAIIIMLSGLENIPRISELKEIRAQSKSRQKNISQGFSYQSPETIEQEPGPGTALEKMRDEMIILPKQQSREGENNIRSPVRDSRPEIAENTMEKVVPDSFGIDNDFFQSPAITPAKAQNVPSLPISETPSSEGATMPDSGKDDNSEPEKHQPPRRRVIVAHEHREPLPVSHHRSASGALTHHATSPVPAPHTAECTRIKHHTDEGMRSKETERQKIERELQRQRMVAISGQSARTGMHLSRNPSHIPEETEKKHEIQKETIYPGDQSHRGTSEYEPLVPQKKTIIISKRKVIANLPVIHDRKNEKVAEEKISNKRQPVVSHPAEDSRSPVSGELNIGMKDSAFRARDAVFEGKEIQRSDRHPPVRDSTLIHTDLKPKKKIGESPDSDHAVTKSNPDSDS